MRGADDVRAVYAEHGQLVHKDVPEPSAGPGQLLVAVKAAGLNAADRLMLEGSHASGATVRPAARVAPASLPLGMEAAGEVLAVGEGVEEFSIGDRVMGICIGAFAPLAVIQAAFAMRVPDRLQWTEAAAVPAVFSTAHDALVTAGRLTTGDHVLVTAASSGVGVAALQLARLLGAGTVAASPASLGTWDWSPANRTSSNGASRPPTITASTSSSTAWAQPPSTRTSASVPWAAASSPSVA
jgi:NADPH:quinone reductase-like Zn-dependent oxidoreductase